RRLPPTSTLSPYTTLFRSNGVQVLPVLRLEVQHDRRALLRALGRLDREAALSVGDPAVRLGGAPGRAADDLDRVGDEEGAVEAEDRKSTRLNSSHVKISYA